MLCERGLMYFILNHLPSVALILLAVVPLLPLVLEASLLPLVADVEVSLFPSAVTIVPVAVTSVPSTIGSFVGVI